MTFKQIWIIGWSLHQLSMSIIALSITGLVDRWWLGSLGSCLSAAEVGLGWGPEEDAKWCCPTEPVTLQVTLAWNWCHVSVQTRSRKSYLLKSDVFHWKGVFSSFSLEMCYRAWWPKHTLSPSISGALQESVSIPLIFSLSGRSAFCCHLHSEWWYHSVSVHITCLMYFSAYSDMENNCQRMQIVGAVPVTFGWYSTSVVGTSNMTAASRICRLLSFNTEIHEAIASIEACFPHETHEISRKTTTKRKTMQDFIWGYPSRFGDSSGASPRCFLQKKIRRVAARDRERLFDKAAYICVYIYIWLYDIMYLYIYNLYIIYIYMRHWGYLYIISLNLRYVRTECIFL